MFDEELITIAQQVIKEFGEAGSTITTAESCTGGLIGGCITSVSGSSTVFNRGFITYSNEAKSEVLGVKGAFVEDFNFTDMNRDEVRRETVKEALEMLLGYGLDDPEEA